MRLTVTKSLLWMKEARLIPAESMCFSPKKLSDFWMTLVRLLNLVVSKSVFSWFVWMGVGEGFGVIGGKRGMIGDQDVGRYARY